MAYLKTRDGVKLFYYDVGRGDPVVLLHGFGASGATWLPFVAPLLKRYRFILPDLRGFGLSHAQPLATPDLLTQHANDLQDLMTTLKLDGVRLGGHSMGACTAMQYQRLHGFAGIRSYLNIDQAPCIRNSGEWSWGLMGGTQAARMARMRELLKDCRGLTGDEPFQSLPKDLQVRFGVEAANFMKAAMHQPLLKFGASRLVQGALFGRLPMVIPTWRITLAAIRSYTEEDYDFRPSLTQIKVPVQVFVGLKSEMYPAEGQLRYTDYVPQAEVVSFKNCGHAIQFERPFAFTRAFSRFLKAA